MAKRKKTHHRRKHSRGSKMSGVGSDLGQVAAGIVIALVADVVINKVSGLEPHGPAADGGNPQPNPNAVLQAIEGFGHGMGMPKEGVIKVGAAVLGVFAADKMPQYRTPLMVASAILAYQGVSHHEMLREHVGYPMSGVTLAAIEDNVQEAIESYKKQQMALAGNEGVNEVYGVTIASPYDAAGARIAGTMQY